MSRKSFLGFLVVLPLCLVPTAFAARSLTVWNNVTAIPKLKFFYVDNSKVKKSQKAYVYSKAGALHSTNTLRFLKVRVDDVGISHARYNQYYKGIPVWGSQLIFHKKQNQKNITTATGQFVTGIEKDLKNTTPKYSVKPILMVAEDHFQAYSGGNWRINLPQTHLVIFVKNSTAKLAYTITFFAQKGNKLQKPFYIIDANDKSIYKHWNDLHNAASAIGQGPGGNDKVLGIGIYNFQYGPDSEPGWNQLGKFEVTQSGNTCTMLNDDVQIASLNNQTLPAGSIWITYYEPANEELDYSAFSYDCSTNLNDGGKAPLNGGYSPNNDAMYAASNTIKMYRDEYGFANPLGSNTAIRIYTHLANYDDAYALSAGESGVYKWHQQVVLGGGKTNFYPLTNAKAIAHELSHIFTFHNSNLNNTDQSGGINEAFADIGSMALNDYINKQYSWYPVEWSIYGIVTKVDGFYEGLPVRYFDDPTKDNTKGGSSIDNVNNYVAGMDVHYSAGIYNKAFYLLAATCPECHGWGIEKAFTMFSNANADYWYSGESFYYGACGVIQEAYNRGENFRTVISAFEAVGVTCKVGSFPN
jgi:pseudolysin